MLVLKILYFTYSTDIALQPSFKDFAYWLRLFPFS